MYTCKKPQLFTLQLALCQQPQTRSQNQTREVLYTIYINWGRTENSTCDFKCCLPCVWFIYWGENFYITLRKKTKLVPNKPEKNSTHKILLLIAITIISMTTTLCVQPINYTLWNECVLNKVYTHGTRRLGHQQVQCNRSKVSHLTNSMIFVETLCVVDGSSTR